MYYTYAYLREDGTPYYIGKGKGNRAYAPHGAVKVPEKDRILFLKTDLTDEEAIKHEIYLISVLGRKDIETGILRNLTDGGDGASGYKHTDAHKKYISEKLKGKERSEEHKANLSKSQKGKTLSEEHKKKIGETHKARGIKPPIRTTQTEEEKQKRSQTMLTFYQNPANIEKLQKAAKKRKRNSKGHFC